MLVETLDALLRQRRAFDEIILVDDGSTDDTAALMRAAYPQIRYVWQSNGHVQRARNTGAAAASSEWIVFCDSDDLLEPDYLAQVEALVGQRPELNLIYCNHCRFAADGVVLTDKFATAYPGYWDGMVDIGTAYLGSVPALAISAVRLQILFPTGLAIKRALFDTIGGFDERMAGNPCEDLEFTLRALMQGTTGVLKPVLARVRQHDGPHVHTNDVIADRLCDNEILQFSLDHHPGAKHAALRAALLAQIERNCRACLYDGFRRADWRVVHRMAAELQPAARTPKEWMKIAIARLPQPLRGSAHRLLR
jgi:glycosyltransferase involved in cell wall biosynthesis